jgi:gluconolactonase
MDATLTIDAFETRDASFRHVIGVRPRLERMAEVDAHEGPVYLPASDTLAFTSLPRRGRSVIKLLPPGQDPVEVPSSTTLPNGMTLGRDGTLVVCEQGDHEHPARISMVDPSTGATTTIVDNWEGLAFNSPNDVVLDPAGAVWFTDPAYGHLQGFRPRPAVGDFVYRHDPVTGHTEVVDDGFVKPNGIAFSPDGLTVYVTDSGANQEAGSFYPHLPHHVIAFDVVDGRRLAGRRLFAVTTPGFPDGIKTDDEGRVYVSSPAGVLVHQLDGRMIGLIPIPGTVNFTFGGPDRNVLFVTTDDAVWAVTLAATGGPRKEHP